ncbi:type VII secretion-associated serine protease mycosin [Pseudosporangium ferrugineum]|uniref:Type VII secretion-associated serine protease mycosin n=1 Tax=Pseudosporangium ferrugineum TaxID=439699 RepID=A0A2T0S4K3_9ACTN|nr:type VII secretion-associated serine protease mycosin [Pseudosporangium ferrugineum]
MTVRSSATPRGARPDGVPAPVLRGPRAAAALITAPLWAVVRRAAVRQAAVRRAAVRHAAVGRAAVRQAVVRRAAVRQAVVRRAAVGRAAVRPVAVRGTVAPGGRGSVAVRRVVAAVVAGVLVVLVSGGPARADEARERQWFWGPLEVAKAQRITKGAGVTVAVLDTGVDARHPDLRGAVLPGRQTVQNKPAGNDDGVGHGTGIAGIIGGRGHGSGDGVLGIAPEAKILPVRPVNDSYFVAQGIRYAVAQGAKVINMSFETRASESLRAALREAAAADVVLVGAAGNEGDKGNEQEYPSAYPEVLTVGALQRNNKIAPFSNHGPQVDLAAPGVEIPAPAPEGRYVTLEGSSAAAAIVSGSAALIRAEHPDLSAAEVVARLTGTAIDRGAKGRDDFYGAGQLDLMAALTAPQPAASSSPPAGANGQTAPNGQAAAPRPPDSTADDGGGLPPLLFVAIGVVLLVVAGGVVLVLRRR